MIHVGHIVGQFLQQVHRRVFILILNYSHFIHILMEDHMLFILVVLSYLEQCDGIGNNAVS